MSDHDRDGLDDEIVENQDLASEGGPSEQDLPSDGDGNRPSFAEAPHGGSSIDDDDATRGGATVTEGDAAEEDPADESKQSLPRHLLQRYRNGIIVGTPTMHYPSRDVVLTVDGDAGLRALAVWAGARQFSDPLDPRVSNAANGWIGFDLDQVMGITWMPGAAASHDRVTIDPVV